MRNNIKVILWFFVFIALSASLVIFADTLALFENDGEGTARMPVGKWVIKVSNVTITNSQVEELVIDSFTYEDSVNVKAGKIAPGTSAYFDLVVDASGCDVAVKYDIDFNVDDMDFASNITVDVEELGENSTVKTGPNTYSGVINLDTIEAEDVVTLRVTLTWNNDEDYNTNDTELGTTFGSKLAVPITVKAVQYLGETLVPYIDQ